MDNAKRYPILSPERERALAVAWRDRKDRAAFDELIGSHLRLVIRLARNCVGYGLPLVELVAEGNVGLVRAAEKFDPDRGFRFTTYAIWWVRSEIYQYVLRSWSLVRIGTTGAEKKLFFNLRRLKADLRAIEHGTMSPEAVSVIATELRVTEAEVIEMNCRLAGHDYSLHAPLEFGAGSEWLDTIADERPTQETTAIKSEEDEHQRHLLRSALMSLSSREREILSERRLRDRPLTLMELSQRYAVSRERIRQIELHAMDRLQKALKVEKTQMRARTV
jgi:RNA polymerase sigma-32 factor